MRPKFIIRAKSSFDSGEDYEFYRSIRETQPDSNRINELAKAIIEISSSEVGAKLIPHGDKSISVTRRPKTYFGKYVEIDTMSVERA